jgi:superfamily II DNA or RNA helicase
MQSEKTIHFLDKLKESGNYNENHGYSKIFDINKRNTLLIVDENGFEHITDKSNYLITGNLSIKSAVDKTKYFLQKLKQNGNYNENYDYSEVKYNGKNEKILIIDENGFKHEILPNLNSKFELGIHTVIDKNKYLIFKLKNILGDKYYDFSLVRYVNATTFIKIKCIHCISETTPNKILSNISYGKIKKLCIECERSRISEYKNLTIDYIDRLKENNIYNDNYDYSKMFFTDMKSKITIIDENGFEHSISPFEYLGGNKLSIHSAIDKTAYYIKKLKESGNYNENYDYSRVDYVSSKDLIEIICKENGHGSFFQAASSHLNGQKCNKCVGGVKSNKEEFISKSNEIHGYVYDYSLVDYINSKTPVKIICSIHNEFEQTPSKHLSGRGCSICGNGYTKEFKLNLLNELEASDLASMEPFELFIIIGQSKLPEDFKSIANTEANSEERLISIKELKKQFEQEIELDNNELSEVTSDTNNINTTNIETAESEQNNFEVDAVDGEITETKKVERTLPTLNSMSEFHSLDNKYYAGMDDEAFASLIFFKTQKMWNEILNKVIDIEKIQTEEGGKHFTNIKNTFLEEYRKVELYETPNGYKGEHLPNLMQKLTVTRLLNQKSLLNLSGTGAGKTLSMILSSRSIGAKISIIVAINSTIDQISKEISKAFPDSVIYTEHKIGRRYDSNNHNYLVLNYEKFQLSNAEETYQDFTNNNIIDFVAFDELQNVKQRGDDESIRRGVLKRLIGRIRENNDNLYVLGMSATPVINNLNEAKSLLEIVTGQEYEDLNTYKSIANALRVYQHLLINGIRYLPNYSGIELNIVEDTDLDIDGYDLIDEILKTSKSDVTAIEKILLPKKLESIKKYLKKGVCIYSYYTTGFKDEIYKFVTNLGFKCACYTGEEEDRKDNLKDFINGKFDILIGSNVIGTGVDGLQKVCNTLIEITQPWTSADEKQLHGRFIRQGSNFDKVNVIIPQVKIKIDDKIWSWDRQRSNLINNKRTLADCAVDGKIPSKIVPKAKTLLKASIESLQSWKDRVNIGDVIGGNRKTIDINLYPELDTETKRNVINSELSEFNRRGKTTLSSTMNKEFNNDPESWFRYHSLRRESVKDWEEIPYEYIATKIKNKNHKIVDFGCGENKFKECVTNDVTSFDHIAIDDTVIACDMSDVSNHLSDESVDVAVFSLALWGTNYKDYIKEAYRVLNWGGNIYIAEPSKKYKTEDDEKNLINLIKEFGFEIVGGIERRNKFIYIRGIK